MKRTKPSGGFSLVEVMVAVTIMGLLFAAVLSFYVQNLKGLYASEQRMKLAGQVKKFTNELIVHGSRANQFILFKSADPADFDGANSVSTSGGSDRQSIPGSIYGAAEGLHPAGDFVVFVYYEIPKPAAEAKHRISKLEGYCVVPDSTTRVGPLRRVLIDLSAAPSTSSVEAILTAAWNTSTGTWRSTASVSTYFPAVRGLVVPEVVDNAVPGSTPPARLFYMSDTRNVIITGQVYSSNKDVLTNTASTYTNSFNFTITPRT